MEKKLTWLVLSTTLTALALQAQTQDIAQESNFGFSLPLTLSGGAMYSGRLQQDGPASPFSAGAQLTLYPTLTLGAHWFAYAAEQIRLAPYYYYDAYEPQHEVYVQTIQAYLGYRIRSDKATVVFKVGQLASAFGAFPLHYDDAENPLLDQPLSYQWPLTLRNDQLPCGVADLLSQYYGYVQNSCGGAWGGPNNGLTPVTLYGLPGVEAEVASHRVDGRIQVTSSSPSDPLSLSHTGQYAQWVLGGGYTIWQGFRVGMSGFRGPYLAPDAAPALPPGTTVRSFPASGVGLDVQWAAGHWSASGEWQRFQYDLPSFTRAPSVISTYGEAKRTLTPRLYIAGRAGWLKPDGATDVTGASTSQFAPWIQSYELGAGWWLNRHQLLKASYEWLRMQDWPGIQNNVVGIQFVTTLHAIDQAFTSGRP
jgi:hypothetical protein